MGQSKNKVCTAPMVGQIGVGLTFTLVRIGETSLKTLQSCLGLRLALLGLIATPNRRYITRLWLPAHPLISAICDITVVVKKVAQNPAVLASFYRQS